MQLNQIPLGTVFKAEPPPLWYVSDGETTVGPVVTGLLVRGIEQGRVPEHSYVRLVRGPWRSLAAVREISALTRPSNLEATGQELAEWITPLERVRDEMEYCHNAAWLCLVATGAESAMVHLRSRVGAAVITRAVVGPMSRERLGHRLAEDDLLLKSARLGRPVFGPPYGAKEDALAMRFASSQGGAGAVAMIPAFINGRFAAMLELSRPGHAFRRVDLQRAERIFQRVLRQRAA